MKKNNNSKNNYTQTQVYSTSTKIHTHTHTDKTEVNHTKTHVCTKTHAHTCIHMRKHPQTLITFSPSLPLLSIQDMQPSGALTYSFRQNKTNNKNKTKPKLDLKTIMAHC
jgi:hypothetical protein